MSPAALKQASCGWTNFPCCHCLGLARIGAFLSCASIRLTSSPRTEPTCFLASRTATRALRLLALRPDPLAVLAGHRDDLILGVEQRQPGLEFRHDHEVFPGVEVGG